MKDEAARLVLKFFNGDDAKMNLWFQSRNPLLGNVSPIEMIQAGRYKRLLKFIKNQLRENKA